jgi:hypothetical protein
MLLGPAIVRSRDIMQVGVYAPPQLACTAPHCFRLLPGKIFLPPADTFRMYLCRLRDLRILEPRLLRKRIEIKLAPLATLAEPFHELAQSGLWRLHQVFVMDSETKRRAAPSELHAGAQIFVVESNSVVQRCWNRKGKASFFDGCEGIERISDDVYEDPSLTQHLCPPIQVENILRVLVRPTPFPRDRGRPFVQGDKRLRGYFKEVRLRQHRPGARSETKVSKWIVKIVAEKIPEELYFRAAMDGRVRVQNPTHQACARSGAAADNDGQVGTGQ